MTVPRVNTITEQVGPENALSPHMMRKQRRTIEVLGPQHDSHEPRADLARARRPAVEHDPRSRLRQLHVLLAVLEQSEELGELGRCVVVDELVALAQLAGGDVANDPAMRGE